MGPPLCGTGNGRDGDKLLCNNEEDINIVMGIDESNTIFLTQEDQELFELQQFKVEYGESFDYKQGYDFAINEIQIQYNLRSKKTNEASTKNNVPTQQNQNKKNVEAPKTKNFQILPRENKKNSN